MKATKLIELLKELIKNNGENIDVMTFSGELGIYNEWDEVKRIRIQD